jgi:hypothetical protein
MGAAAAAGTSIAGAGIGAYAQILSSRQGTAAGMNYKASIGERRTARARYNNQPLPRSR